jgi:hypothetical protein
MIHIVEEIKLLLLLGNRLVIVVQAYPRKHILGSYKNGCICVCVCDRPDLSSEGAPQRRQDLNFQ